MITKIPCPYCGRRVQMPDEASGSPIRCTKCGRRLPVPAQTTTTADAPECRRKLNDPIVPSRGASGQASTKRDRPQESSRDNFPAYVSLNQQSDRLQIEIRWDKWVVLCYAVAAVLCGPAVYFYGIAQLDGAIAVSVVITLFAIFYAVDRTIIEASPEQLTIRHKPIPRCLPKRFVRDELSQIFIRKKVTGSSGGGQRDVHFHVMVLLKNGQSRKLTSVHERETATNIKLAIEECMGIVDRDVESVTVACKVTPVFHIPIPLHLHAFLRKVAPVICVLGGWMACFQVLNVLRDRLPAWSDSLRASVLVAGFFGVPLVFWLLTWVTLGRFIRVRCDKCGEPMSNVRTSHTGTGYRCAPCNHIREGLVWHFRWPR